MLLFPFVSKLKLHIRFFVVFSITYLIVILFMMTSGAFFHIQIKAYLAIAIFCTVTAVLPFIDNYLKNKIINNSNFKKV